MHSQLPLHLFGQSKPFDPDGWIVRTANPFLIARSPGNRLADDRHLIMVRPFEAAHLSAYKPAIQELIAAWSLEHQCPLPGICSLTTTNAPLPHFLFLDAPGRTDQSFVFDCHEFHLWPVSEDTAEIGTIGIVFLDRDSPSATAAFADAKQFANPFHLHPNRN